MDDHYAYAQQGVGASAYARDTAVPDPSASRIRDNISSAEQLSSGLHEAINDLEKRLDTVLIPTPPNVAVQQSGTRNAPSGPPPSHVHGRLVMLNEALYGAVQRMRELASRLDV